MKTVDINLARTNELQTANLPSTLRSEGIDMPVKKCVKNGTKLYWFNEGNKTVSIYTEQIHQLSECPDNVLAELISGKINSFIIVNSKAEPLTKEEMLALTKTVESITVKKSRL